MKPLKFVGITGVKPKTEGLWRISKTSAEGARRGCSALNLSGKRTEQTNTMSVSFFFRATEMFQWFLLFF